MERHLTTHFAMTSGKKISGALIICKNINQQLRRVPGDYIH